MGFLGMRDVIFGDSDISIFEISSFIEQNAIRHDRLEDSHGKQNGFAINKDSDCRKVVDHLLDLGHPFTYKYLSI